jgi:hypothetical protein
LILRNFKTEIIAVSQFLPVLAGFLAKTIKVCRFRWKSKKSAGNFKNLLGKNFSSGKFKSSARKIKNQPEN